MGAEAAGVRDGTQQKFVNAVEQITYSGTYGRERAQRVLYVTERAVFRLTERGVALIEVAPGIDVRRDVLDRMAFAPLIPAEPAVMPAECFLA